MSGKWWAYFELLRFPAVFTVVADVMMGYLVTHGDLQPVHIFALTLLASCCLYLGGMVLNDVYDADLDARERPERPIPSGIASRAAPHRLDPAPLRVSSGWRVFCRDGGRVESPAFSSPEHCGCTTRSPSARRSRPRHGNLSWLERALVMGIAAYSSRPSTFATIGIGIYVRSRDLRRRHECPLRSRTSRRWHARDAGGNRCRCSTPPRRWCIARASARTVGWEILWLVIAVILRRCAFAAANPEPRLVQIAVRGACVR